jgi:hypothetical protein
VPQLLDIFENTDIEFINNALIKQNKSYKLLPAMNTINIDLHCDLLYYLLRSDATIDDREIGCSLPYLKEGM